jgi:hypothetical protein
MNCFDENQEELLEGKDPDRKYESANLHVYLTFRHKIDSNRLNQLLRIKKVKFISDTGMAHFKTM